MIDKWKKAHWPLHVMRGDSVQIDGVIFTMGQNATFKTPDDALDFFANSHEVEITETRYPFLFGLFGGSVETKTYSARKRNE